MLLPLLVSLCSSLYLILAALSVEVNEGRGGYYNNQFKHDDNYNVEHRLPGILAITALNSTVKVTVFAPEIMAFIAMKITFMETLSTGCTFLVTFGAVAFLTVVKFSERFITQEGLV